MSVYRTGVPLIASDLEEEDPLLHPSLRNKGIKAFIGLPLRTRERCTGVLFVRYTESHSFSEEEVQALSLFANQAAVALENARLYHAEQLARERADALREISRVVGSTLELDEVLSLVLRQAKRVLTYDSASILLFADDQPAMAAVIGYEDEEMVKTEVALRLGDSPILQDMARDRQPILIADAREDERWIWVPGAESVRAWLGVPLLVRGEMIGVLMVDSTQPGLYTAADVAIAQSLAGQVAVAIDNARLYTSLEQEKARLELLYRLGRQLSESLDVRDVAQRALDELCTVVGAMRGIILVRERDRARLQLVAVSGYTAESVATLDRRMQLVVGNGLVGWVATKRSPVLVSDVLQDERWLPVSGLDDGVRSAFSVPLFSGDETIGAFSIYSDQPGFFNDDHRRLAESVAATVAVAIQNARLYEQAQHRLEILNNLNRASQALTSSLEVQKVLEQIVGLAGSVVNSDYTSVALLDEKGHLALEVEDFRGLPPLSRRLRPSGVTHQVLESGLMMVMDEISADGTLTPPPHHSNGELLRANPAIVTAGIRSAVAVPIQIKGKTLGVLFVHSRTPRAFQGQLTLLSTFANQAAVALENARLYEQAQQEIAERKRTQDALRASEEQYRLLTETARDIIIAHDMTGRITYANPAALDASGYDEEEFRQLNITAFLPPEQLPAMRARAAQRAAGDAGLHVFEVDLRTKSGRLLPVEIGSSLLLEQDRPVGVLLIARDITKRRQAQEALQRRATQLATLGEVGRQMASLLPLGPLLERIVDLIREAFSYRYVVILLVDPLAKTLELKAGAGFEVERLKPLGLKIGEEGICGWVAASGEPLLMNDVSQEPRYYALEPLPDTRSELAVPIRVQDQVVGVLDVQSTELNAFDQADLFILQTLADQAAVAIENARLFEAEREQRELSESLVEAAVAVGSTLELDEVLDHLLEQVERVVPADTCNVMLIEEDIARIARWRGYQRFGSKEFASTATFPLAEVVYLQQMIKTRKPVMISDTATYPGWVQLPSQVWLRSYLGAPIQVGGVTVGFLNVDGSRSGQFDSADARRLEAFAHHAATAIENARLFEAERRRREEAETLRELSMNIASTLDFDQIVERATHILGRTLGVEYLDFVFPDPDGEHMVPHPSMLGFILPPGGVLRFPIAHSITGRVYRTGQPVLVPDVSQDPDFRRTASSTEVRSELAVPVKVGDEVVAVLNVESRQLHKFTVEDLHFLSAVAAQLAVAMENARLFQAEREQRELSESLVEAAVAVSSTLELEEVLDRLLEQVDRVLPGDACNVMLIEEDIARVARWRGYQRFGSKKYVSTATFPLAEAANLQQMVETGKPMMISDTATYPGWVQVPAQAWLRSYLGAPIQVGRVTVGFLNVDGARPGQFDSADARRLEAFAYHAATAIENAGLYQELRLHAAQLEERVTERTAQLQAQYARLDALLRSVSDGILVTDAQGDLIQTNPIAQRWLTQTLSPMDAERLQTLIHNLARRAQERPEAILELTGLDLQLNAAPILEREAEKATAVVVAHDVSHIKALERMKSRFVTNVSHELRTPITTIKLYVALLQQKPEKWEKYLDALTQEAEHLARLVEDVLQVSRIDDGRLEIHPRPTPLNTFTELIVSKHQVLARSSKVTLSYQPAAPDPLALADPGQLTQALNNLVRNALHYTPEGGKVTVSTGTAESRGRLWATMAVADTGMGIPPEELSHIFERFFRGQQPQSLQLSGSGLGLAGG
jgi:PAS domain S-box-containing protein